MTSATLSTAGSFAHISERTGFHDPDELLLGSPFDYAHAALLSVPEDMPEPNSRAYQSAVESAVTDAAVAAGGATMALFTSHAALQATASAIRGGLQSQGLSVLAQGIDGTPQRLVSRFLDDPRSVLLGTASFWEGVDLAGESLKVLLLARLPFNVPTEPVFSARSEMYDNSFGEYAVPQAILRLRQGFGRLIRTKSDRGVAVVLDRRIVSRRYGREFLESLPPVARRDCRLRDLGDVVRDWLGA
jgi:DNA polymerase-3 subunit epsilon/ATP-dependent DNA helicase DinG